jgi:Actin-like ATPase involved in cell division
MPVVFLFVYGHLSCTRLKGYFWTVPKMEVLMADSSRNAGKIEKINMEGVPEQLVFGLDIGTRSVVGIIGYKNNDGTFVVVAQVSVEHHTRAMLDGQIHDIGKVAATIEKIHKKLEDITGRRFKDVCIAAAGRVLMTVEAEAQMDFNSDTVITSEHIYTLDMIGVENAYSILREEKQSDDIRFYCVGYSVKHYYQNGYMISNLEGHKANNIKEELIATFLPNEVVDGLYAAVERTGLYVSNLTLEPIAAINVAIPEKFRLLNIALVDVGAGTSDISITKDGSIIAYGMIPCAGDEITECIAKYYLTDFNEADRLKCASTLNEEVEFNDIMGLPQRVTADDIAAVTEETIKMITKGVADKIKELNGGKSVSAVFVVGGGGKAKGFTENLAEYLGLQKERVALRGSEVLGNVNFMQDDVVIDSLLVTPVGICLNYYEQRNNFIFVTVNGERIKLYNNNKLTIMDAAVQMGFPNEDLFPKRGKSLIYYVNGEKRMLRGKEGEAAIVRLNGKQTGMSTHVEKNCKVDIIPSTRGADARLEISSLREYRSNMKIIFNGKEIVCPRFVTVNGSLVSGFYEVREGDRIEILGYYTLEQVLEFMDIICRGKIYVNNVIAPLDAKVYDNFSIACEIMKEEPNYTELMAEYGDGQFPVTNDVLYPQEEPEVQEEPDTESYNNEPEEAVRGLQDEEWDSGIIEDSILSEEDENLTEPEEIVPEIPKAAINITVNGEQVVLNGKPSYILVDVLDFYPVDTSVAHGDHLETSVNGEMCDFTCSVNEGDSVRIEWVD